MFEFINDLVTQERKKYNDAPDVYDDVYKKLFLLYYQAYRYELQADFANVALASAIKFIAREKRKELPDKIKIASSDSYLSKCIWTAFMVVGEHGPIKFNHKSLLIPSASAGHFDASQEVGWFTKFSFNSFYHKNFKNVDRNHIESYLAGSSELEHQLKCLPYEVIIKKIKDEVHTNRAFDENFQNMLEKSIEKEKQNPFTQNTLLKALAPAEAKKQLEKNRIKAETERQRQDALAEKKRQEALDKVAFATCSLRNLFAYGDFGPSQVSLCKIEELLSKGADINDTKDGYSVLMLAVNANDDRVIEFLLKAGANPLLRNQSNNLASDLASRNSLIYSVLKGYELIFAAQAGDFETVKKIPNINAVIDCQKADGSTALMIAVEKKHEAIVTYLLSLGASVDIKRGDNKGALDLAKGRILALLRKPSYTTKPAFEDYKATEVSESPTKYSSLNSFEPSSSDDDLFTEIEKSNASLRSIKRLLNKGADVNQQDAEGYTPLMLAVDKQNDRVAEYLLKQGANVSLLNANNEMASDLASRSSSIYKILKGNELLDAVAQSDMKRINVLINQCANVNFQGIKGYTPLLIAVEQGSVEIIQYLLLLNADPSSTLIDGRGVFDLAKDEPVRTILSGHFDKMAPVDSMSSSASGLNHHTHGFFGLGNQDDALNTATPSAISTTK